jgi:ankyrin repeat protein
MGCEESVVLMCENGADPTLKNGNGYTVMHGMFMQVRGASFFHPKVFL